jgi:hypothetical protein
VLDDRGIDASSNEQANNYLHIDAYLYLLTQRHQRKW